MGRWSQFKGPYFSRSKWELSAGPRRLLLFSSGSGVRQRFTRSSGATSPAWKRSFARTQGQAPVCGLWRLEAASPVTATIFPRGQQQGKQQSQSDARPEAQGGFHPRRGPAAPAGSPAPSPGAPLRLAPPPTSALPNRRRRGDDRGRRRGWCGGRTPNGRSRLRGDVTRRRTCRALRIPAALLPLPWVGDALVRSLQPLFFLVKIRPGPRVSRTEGVAD